MDKTTNFDLPQWVKADQIKMDDFNGAFASIDGDFFNVMGLPVEQLGLVLARFGVKLL